MTQQHVHRGQRAPAWRPLTRPPSTTRRPPRAPKRRLRPRGDAVADPAQRRRRGVSTTRCGSTRATSVRPSPGAPPGQVVPVTPARADGCRRDAAKARQCTWAGRPAPRSPGARSTWCSSAATPTVALVRPLRWQRRCAGGACIPACACWWCRVGGGQARGRGRASTTWCAAGGEWREPGCSMLSAMNGDWSAPGNWRSRPANRNSRAGGARGAHRARPRRRSPRSARSPGGS